MGRRLVFQSSGWADFYQGAGKEILQRYRNRTVIPYIVEFLLLALIFFFANYFYTLPASIITTIMLIAWSNKIMKASIKEAKPFAIAQPDDSSVPVAFSLTRRRLTDYTNPAVESSIIVLTILGVGLFARHYWYFNWDGNHTLSAFLPLILYLYLQVGGLLLKQALVRLRLTLPGERTDQYFKLFEDRRLIFLKLCDYFRIICAVVLPYFLFDQIAAGVLQWRHARMFHLIIGFSIMAAKLLIVYWYVKSMPALIKKMDISELVRMQRRVADKPASFGGYAFFDSNNPGALVRTSNGLVLNFANKRVYFVGLYLIGLVALITMVHFY